MKLEYLSFLSAIQQTGSLSKSADLLHTTPQNVSRVLKLLENETKLSLFKRTNQGILLTPAGKDFLNFADQTLESYQKFLNKYNDDVFQRHTVKGTVHIVTIPVSGIPFLNNLILDFNRIYPDVSVTILEMDLNASVQYFLEHDDVIAALPIRNLLEENYCHLREHQEEFVWLPIVTSQLAALVEKSSPLSTLESISLKRLCNEPLSFMAKNSYKDSGTYAILEIYHLTDYLKETLFCTSNFDQFYQSIISNGFSTLIDRLAFQHINTLYQKHLSVVPLTDPSIKIYHGVAFHNDALLSESAKVFYHFCQTYNDAPNSISSY